MIHNSRELRASVRALNRLVVILKGARKEYARYPGALSLMEEQVRDLMRPIRRDIRKYLAAK